MPLTCECGDIDDCEWYWTHPTSETILNTKQSKHCCSCHELIKPGSTVLPFHRCKYDSDGEEVPLSPWYMCEACGELYSNLEELGFCITLGEDNMRNLTREYALTYGPQSRNPQNPSVFPKGEQND